MERINILDQHFLISHNDLLLISFFAFIHPEIPNFVTGMRRNLALYTLYIGYSLIIIQDTKNPLVSFRLKMSIKQDGWVLQLWSKCCCVDLHCFTAWPNLYLLLSLKSGLHLIIILRTQSYMPVFYITVRVLLFEPFLLHMFFHFWRGPSVDVCVELHSCIYYSLRFIYLKYNGANWKAFWMSMCWVIINICFNCATMDFVLLFCKYS